MDTTLINAGSIKRTDVPPLNWTKSPIYVAISIGYVVTEVYPRLGKEAPLAALTS